MLPPLKPIPIKDRLSILFVEKGQIDVLDGAFVVVDVTGVRTHIPVGGVACLMLEPGTRVSHAAAALAARVGTLLVWVGEAGVRSMPRASRAAHVLTACSIRLNSRSMKPCGLKWYVRCTNCVLTKNRPSAVMSINCAALRARGSNR